MYASEKFIKEYSDEDRPAHIVGSTMAGIGLAGLAAAAANKAINKGKTAVGKSMKYIKPVGKLAAAGALGYGGYKVGKKLKSRSNKSASIGGDFDEQY